MRAFRAASCAESETSFHCEFTVNPVVTFKAGSGKQAHIAALEARMPSAENVPGAAGGVGASVCNGSP